MLEGTATRAGTAAYWEARPHPDGHVRTALGLSVGSVGMGTYLGDTSEAASRGYEEAALLALGRGCNVLDTASNYRDQRSERDLGRALRRFVDGGGDRAGVVVSSKAGFLHGDADAAMRGADWFNQEYVLDGTVRGADIAANAHCMSPAYVRRELERSRRNLGLEALDVLFVHNPETQLAAGVPEDVVLARLREAFAALEEACDAGHLGVYGVATWDGLRVGPDHPAHLSLVKLVHEAGQARMAVGGRAAQHHLRAVQLPVNPAMPEAATEATQAWKFGTRTPLTCAQDVGMLVYASASLMQTRLRGRVPDDWKEALGTTDDLETCLQFTRSVPGVHAALVGMGRPEHAEQDLGWALARPPSPEAVEYLIG